MEALKWLDGVSESTEDQRAAVERNSPPGTLYRSHVRARVFGVPSRSVDLSIASKAATRSSSPAVWPNFLQTGDDGFFFYVSRSFNMNLSENGVARRFIGREEALSLEIGYNRVCFESRIWNLKIWVVRYLSG